jgi:pyrroloquinoline quinone biosynthesis protein B
VMARLSVGSFSHLCRISSGKSFSLCVLCVSVSLWLVTPVLADEAIVLGIAQDGGVPHIGCTQALCVEARRDPARRERVAALGLIDAAGARFLIDATPDIASQIESLNAGRGAVERRRPVDGILLTHAHIGHYAGLMFLGREALGADRVPVYATARMARFLRDNSPWRELVTRGNIALTEITPGEEFAFGQFRVVAVSVPHRDELSDTVGYRVRGRQGAVLYVPDVDKWERWNRRLADEVAAVDIALLDGTFYSPDELPDRDVTKIKHPLITATMDLLEPLVKAGKVRVWFTHLNHSNPAFEKNGAARRAIEARGFRVVEEGEEVGL